MYSTITMLQREDAFKPYFNMEKFEDNIYNKTALRETRIKKRKRIRLLDKIITLVILVLFIYLCVILANICFQNCRLLKVNMDLKKLETTLESKINNNNGVYKTLKSEMKFEDLKMKAYMDLNMITPTEKNIIYFDKSDNGFVRQYENIR